MPSSETSQPSSTNTRLTNASEAPSAFSVAASSCFSIMSMLREPKMLRATISTTKAKIAQMAAFSARIIR